MQNPLTHLRISRTLLQKSFIKPALMFVGFGVILLTSLTVGLPDKEIRVDSFDPVGTSSQTTNITIVFSKAMVAPEAVNQQELAPPITIEPPIPGVARWIDVSTLRIFPDAHLRPSTEYLAEIKSDKTWASGFKILHAHWFKFRTPVIAPTQSRYSVEPADEVQGKVRLIVWLSFNCDVSPEMLKGKTSIKSVANTEVSELRFTIPSGADNQIEYLGQGEDLYSTALQPDKILRLVSEPFSQTKNVQEYLLKIERGLGCTEGNLSMANDVSIPIRIAPRQPLNIHGVYSVESGDKPAIFIGFNQSIVQDDAAGFITIDPLANTRLEFQGYQVVVFGDFVPGEAYTISIKKGLKARAGAELDDYFTTTVRIPELSPSVRFTSAGIFLPRGGNGLVEITSTNVNTLTVEVEQIFANNIVYFLVGNYGYQQDYWYEQPSSLYGRKMLTREKSLDMLSNKPLTTTIDVAGLIPDTARGIFKVSVRDKNERWISDNRFALLTDIGMSARLADDYLMVWAHSLATSEPLNGIKVSLISKNNQTLLSVTTDSRGIAFFPDIKHRLEGYEPFLITGEFKGDLSYIRLDQSAIPITDFDVSGRPYLSDGYEAFVYSDRGIYRPGDTVHLVSVVRGTDVSMPPSFPFFVTVSDPKGRKQESFRLSTDKTALSEVTWVVPDFAQTGKYSVAAVIGEELTIGRHDFLVEEFVPDKIKVAVATSQKEYGAGDTVSIHVAGHFLFGPPAANYSVSGQITIEPHAIKSENYKSYSFSNSERTFKTMTSEFGDAVLSESGEKDWTYQIPSGMRAPSVLKGLVALTVSEAGGRGVSGYSEILIHPYPRYIGLRADIDEYAKKDEPVNIALVCVDQGMKPVSLDVCKLTLMRIVYHTLYKADRTGVSRWVSEREMVKIDSTVVTVGQEGATATFSPREYGHYAVIGEDAGGGHSAMVEFYVSGWGWAPWALKNPDRIELAFDKDGYAVGDVAHLQVRSPFGGKLLLTVEKDGVITTMSKEMVENTAVVDIHVQKEFFPNAYVTASIIRPALSLEPNLPARAFGLVPISLVTQSRRLQVVLSAPQVITPRRKVPVQIDLGSAMVAEVTLSATDAGILQLTEYQTPDVASFFYGKRRPHLAAYDMYSYLYPRVNQAESHLSPAGDKKFAQSRLKHLNPFAGKRIKPVSLWSGVVKTNADGKATVTLDVPEFNGKLILHAVAVNRDKFGSASREMLVRDNIVMQEHFPRFVAPDDEVNGLITFFNNTSAEADITVSLDISGPMQAISATSRTIRTKPSTEGRAIFRLKAKQALGRVDIRAKARTASDSAYITFELPCRPAVPPLTKYGSGVVTPTQPGAFTLPSGWIDGTDQYTLYTSGLAAATFGRNIQYLLAYPYGCLEQTTSRVMPLIFFEDLARVADPAFIGKSGSDYYLRQGLNRILDFMLPDNSFAMWPGGTRGYTWTTVYASHCLMEANKAGHFIEKSVLSRIEENLERIANGKHATDNSASFRVYAALVLAQSGKLEKKGINFLKNLSFEQLPAFTKYQAAYALALTGNTSESKALIPDAIQPNLFEPETGGYYNSGVRTDAMLLEALLAIEPQGASAHAVAQSLMERARAGYWYTTQENAHALVALGRYFKASQPGGFTGTLRVASGVEANIDSSGYRLETRGLAGREVKIDLTSGNGPCFYFWQATGIPSSPVATEFEKGIRVRRSYVDDRGNPVNLDSIASGQQLVGIITIEALDKSIENVVINDMLPAGMEIENPRLKTTPRLSWIPSGATDVDYQDIRDDRVLIFTQLHARQKASFYYSVRAIAEGTFAVPPVMAECMYNPLIAGSGSSGRMTVR
jgi:alpha-2-macroglobulin